MSERDDERARGSRPGSLDPRKGRPKKDPFPSRTTLIVQPSVGRWHPLGPTFGIISGLSNIFHRLDLARPGGFPDLRIEPDLVVASDYSGDHAGAPYNTLSFLITNPAALVHWERARSRVRSAFLRDGRRVAFKNLGDRQRAQALPHLLRIADQLPGVLLTVAISKAAGSMFEPVPKPLPALAARWSKHVLEHVLRCTHFISFLLAGLSRPGQNVLWVTDEDAIAANESHLRDLTTVLAYVASSYLPHTLNHLRCTTTGIADDGTRAIEDFAALPDLAAGGLAEYLRARMDGLASPPSAKMTTLMQWFCPRRTPLYRVFATIDGSAGRPVTVTTIRFNEP